MSSAALNFFSALFSRQAIRMDLILGWVLVEFFSEKSSAVAWICWAPILVLKMASWVLPVSWTTRYSTRPVRWFTSAGKEMARAEGLIWIWPRWRSLVVAAVAGRGAREINAIVAKAERKAARSARTPGRKAFAEGEGTLGRLMVECELFVHPAACWGQRALP